MFYIQVPNELCNYSARMHGIENHYGLLKI